MKTKKEKTESITAQEFLDRAQFRGLSEVETMIEFAKQKVAEALEETSKHFKNPENVSHVKNHYKLDKIV